SLLAEKNAEAAEKTGYLKCPACFIVSNMKTPVKALSWQQAAKDYAAACGAEIHIVNESHTMYAKIPEKLSKVFKAFLYKNNICDKQKPHAEEKSE
ncbi:MAG: alpha/beta hydrolase, partial [Ruminococcus sp.]|nr:alpha/beta hydrolase [Ruminococcus sp.]